MAIWKRRESTNDIDAKVDTGFPLVRYLEACVAPTEVLDIK
jgi:hypothetical protein